MVRAANKDNVAADMRPTDYRGAVKRLGTIDNKASRQQKIAKEIQDVYTACEAICGVNKTAAKMFRALMKLEPPERLEVFRDLNGLLDAGGIPQDDGDMVDQAENKVVHLRLPEGGGDEGEGLTDDEIDELNPDEKPVDGDDFEMPQEELEQQQGRLEKARGRAKAAAAAAPAEPPAPPADDSDLADAGEE